MNTIHTNITKEEAYKLMEQGHKVCHEYYSGGEYLYLRNGRIYDENNYDMGTRFDPFWEVYQKWPTGWATGPSNN